jgi:RNA polymerase sigma-70 factor, ECF subfamily
MVNATTNEDAGTDPNVWDGKFMTFTEIAEQRRTQLLWLAQRMTNNREEAEDILQEALLKAFKSLGQFRGESQMGTWIAVIVQNTGREWLRRRKRWTCLPLEEIHDRDEDPMELDLPDPADDPEQCCERKELERMMFAEMKGLNSVCATALRMCVLEELSHLDAARELGVNVFTVKSRVFHGKRLLKRAISRRMEGREDGGGGVSRAGRIRETGLAGRSRHVGGKTRETDIDGAPRGG